MKIISKIKKWLWPTVKYGFLAILIIIGLFALWTTTISLPDLENFEERQVAQSTKIYDRTGETILFDVHGDIKRTVIPLSEMSDHIKNATIAVEDAEFYEHNGIQISAIVRAIWNNIKAGDLLGGQGGSTITQQVIKNALLTTDKKVSRKLKEWVLAPRLEKILTKDQILEIYLNEVPYGGTVYGVQEAARRFYSKDAKDLTLAESAFLAALPQAPTYYSPYGNNLAQLEFRKNHVLDQMERSGFISNLEKEEAQKEIVTFERQEEFGIKAPHFVMYVREQLEREFGKDVVEEGGLKVVTSLDWELQQEAEDIVKQHIETVSESVDAENGSIVAIDPENGEILVMVGSRDYFDEEIDGNFNITTAERQPGSAFKPIVYAEAFNKGYLPDTVVFDLQTEFSAACKNGGNCYSPRNYDGTFSGPISLRDALAQSRNIPAVKTLYLAGLRDSLNLAKAMGIETLTNVDQYGLTLVLGGGEVRPLDMASVYGVFAAEGIKAEQTPILKIEDASGEILFEIEEPKTTRVLSENISRMVSDVLSDNNARAPVFGFNSYLNFPGRDVAVKTGTTNEYHDAWTVGYTPNIAVASWMGNNDNRPMASQAASQIVTPMWNQFMQIVLEREEYGGNFAEPLIQKESVKPIIAGFWKGEEISAEKNEDGEFDIIGGGGGIHNILHWIETSDPLGPAPVNPELDPQYSEWEKSVRSWVNQQNIIENFDFGSRSSNSKKLTIISPKGNAEYEETDIIQVKVSLPAGKQIISSSVELNSKKIGELSLPAGTFTLYPLEVKRTRNRNTLTISVFDNEGNEYKNSVKFDVNIRG